MRSLRMKQCFLASGQIRLLSIPVLILGFLFTSMPSQAHLDMTYPDGPVTLMPNQQVEIGWDVYIDHGPGTIKIELSTDGGNNYSLLVENITHIGSADRYGSYLWSVPEVDSSQCKIRITYSAFSGGDFYNGLYPGENDPTFTIQYTPSIELVLENGVNGYKGTRDTTLYEGSGITGDYEDNSNGGGEHLFAGNTNQGFARRALIAFDLSGIPETALILSASLQLTVSKTIAGSYSQTLHRLTQDWGEGTQDAPLEEGTGIDAASGDATWISNFHNSSNWSNPGAEGDFVSIASATASAGAIGSQLTWKSTRLVQDIQDWIQGNSSNYGWIVIGDESVSATAKRFYSSESTTATTGQKPRLVIRYSAEAGIRTAFWMVY